MDSESFYLIMAKPRTERCTCIPARYGLTFLIFCGLFVVFVLRANLSVAIVAMVNNTAISSNSQEKPSTCIPKLDNSTSYNFEQDGEFEWDTTQQSLMLGAFYYGYCLTQLPGGWIAERFGGKWPFGLGILLTSLFTVLTPIAARTNIILAVFIRITKGLGEGITYPAMYALFSRWAPLKERSFLIAIASVGANLGTILGMPITAILCEKGFDNGWPSAFYICGIFGFLWFVPWSVIAASRPTRNPRIAKTELTYLKHALGPLKKRPPTPWISILTSRPVWAVTMARFAGYWGLFTLICELPNYLSHEMGYSMDQNGAINAMVYTAQSFGMIAGGYLSDLMRTRSSVSINLNRKIFESIACLGPAFCLVSISFADCNRTLIISLFILSQLFYGFNAGGSIPAMVDLAPDLAGTVTGIVLTVASCAGFAAPMVAGKVLQKKRGLADWNELFTIGAGMYGFGAFCFVFFGSSEVQTWGRSILDHDVTRTANPHRRMSKKSLVTSSFTPESIVEEDSFYQGNENLHKTRTRNYTTSDLPDETVNNGDMEQFGRSSFT